jgi:hypothetical protein
MTELQTVELPIATPSQAEISQLEKLYTLREPSQVLEFIEKHPFLLPLLLEAPNKIHSYFPHTPLILEVDIDPESSSMDDDQLAILIASEIDPEESVDKLCELNRDWAIDFQRLSRWKLLVMMGY